MLTFVCAYFEGGREGEYMTQKKNSVPLSVDNTRKRLKRYICTTQEMYLCEH